MSDGADQREGENERTGAAIARSAVERAVADLRRGMGVVLRDSGPGGNAVLAIAAEAADAAEQQIARTGTAPSCVIPQARAAALMLPPVDSRTVAIPCAGTDSMRFDIGFVRAIAGAEGDLARLKGRTAVPADDLQDTAVELVKLARLLPAAIVARIPGDAGRFAEEEGLLTVETGWIEDYRSRVDDGAVTLVSHAPVPLEGAEHCEIYAFRPHDGGKEHLAIVIGEPAPDSPVLVRIHSECFTGDLLGSLRCDCGEQLRGAIQAIADNGGGMLLYLAQEGRGIGLVNKLRAYRLQDDGFDTIEANERLGFEADERAYRPAATILHALGVARVRLLTNNPAKLEGLSASGIEVVERVPHAFPANGHNDRYLSTKAARAGHLL
ncbi:MAG: GTP cyclohydrolase II [Alphaproteobacteria bacterium]|nr:GTP cyclohydrolase II [Alphaproteobacteria bacterium]